MTSSERGFVVAAALLAGALAGRAEGATAADTCQAAKLKVTGKYAYCRLKAEANGGEAGHDRPTTRNATPSSSARSQRCGDAGGKTCARPKVTLPGCRAR